MNAKEILSMVELMNNGSREPRTASSTVKEPPKPMAIYLATCPKGEIVVNHRGVEQDGFLFCVMGYTAEGRLNVYHWTSRDSRAYLKAVLLNVLRLCKERGTEQSPEDLHVLPVAVCEGAVPEGAIWTNTRDRHTIPVPHRSIEELIADRMSKLQEAKAANDERAIKRHEAKIEKLTARMAAKAAKLSEPKAASPTSESKEEVATPPEVPEEIPPVETFRTKRMAEAVAKERGLHNDNVIKDDNGEWIIVVR